jgi:diguanylate cyclase (GGDEF)-like protein
MAIKTIPPVQRQQFFTELSRILQTQESDGCCGLLIVDINNFKRYNRSYGYGTGDVVLANLYSRLGHMFSNSEIFRIGDNEFSIILKQIDSPAFIAIASQRILEMLDEKIMFRDRAITVNVNIGLAYSSQDNPLAPQDLVQAAEHSLFYAKKTNKPFCLDVPDEDQDFFAHLDLEEDLAEALYEGDLQLVYQPKIELATGKAVCAETLLRWDHPTKGSISPPIIIELANRLGKQQELGKWILNTALREYATIRDKPEYFGMAINVPSSLIHESEFFAMVMHSVHLWGVDPAMLTLEISEEAVIEGREFGLDALAKLRRQGIRISIDDFGTGYSSMNYFRSIPADEIKIDRAFIGNMLTDSNDLKVVRLCLEIANIFELDVVAEGVENGAVIERLTSMKCRFAQGYFYSKPLGIEELAEWVNTHTTSRTTDKNY